MSEVLQENLADALLLETGDIVRYLEAKERDEVPEMSPLEVCAVMKNLTELVKKAEEALLLDANTQYEQLRAEYQDKPFSFGGAMFKKAAVRSKWTFSPDVERMELQLKKLKEQEKKNRTAKEEKSALDPAKSRLFSITLLAGG